MSETAQEKVARIRAELAAKRGGAAAPAAVQTSPIPAVAQAFAPPPAAPAPTPPASEYAHIPGMTDAVWGVLNADTRAAVLAQHPAPVVAAPPAPAAPSLYEQQTAPINPPDLLQGQVPPTPTDAPAVPPAAPKTPRRKTTAVDPRTAAPTEPSDPAVAERIAVSLESIAALLEVIATRE